MKLDIYQIDAFTKKIFGGNPAAVCPLDEWIAPDLMQKIALENNLSETAFFVKKGSGNYEIRWFMPHDEIDLCGHATLASAYVIFNYLDTDINTVHFHSQSGELICTKSEDESITLNFPSRPPTQIEMPKEALAAFNHQPSQALASRDLVLLFESEEEIKTLQYDLRHFKDLPYICIIATARGTNSDFVSRVFDAHGPIDEDPVTGSAHCSLIPYWSQKLDRKELSAIQLSRRRGELSCRDAGERVFISGSAVTYAKGCIWTE